MGKTLADVDLQVRQLIGDYQRSQFTDLQVAEAINWGQNAIMRLKGFKVASRLYDLTTYPTGDLPSDFLTIKRVQLVQADLPALGYYTITVAPLTTVLADSVAAALAVTITRYGGFSGTIDVFIPVNLTGSDAAGIYINSPTSLGSGLIGNYVNDVQVGDVAGDSGFMYLDAPDSFAIDVMATGAALGSFNYSNIFLTGLTSMPPVRSNNFSIT